MAFVQPPLMDSTDGRIVVTDLKTSTGTELEWTELDRKAVDTTRALAADAVQKTGNGHPGTSRRSPTCCSRR
jgi:hypothetical protein